MDRVASPIGREIAALSILQYKRLKEIHGGRVARRDRVSCALSGPECGNTVRAQVRATEMRIRRCRKI